VVPLVALLVALNCKPAREEEQNDEAEAALGSEGKVASAMEGQGVVFWEESSQMSSLHAWLSALSL